MIDSKEEILKEIIRGLLEIIDKGHIDKDGKKIIQIAKKEIE